MINRTETLTQRKIGVQKINALFILLFDMKQNYAVLVQMFLYHTVFGTQVYMRIFTAIILYRFMQCTYNFTLTPHTYIL